MNMSDLEKLLNGVQYKAPENFTAGVMEKVDSCPRNSGSRFASKPYYRTGLSLIAASLITLCLNLTPWMDYLMRDAENPIRFREETVDYSRAASSIEYITLKIDSILNKPFRFLTDQLNKEESPHE